MADDQNWLFRPPAPDALNEVAFIIGWALQGCSAPYEAIIQCSKQPLWDVALIFGDFSTEDIVRGFFKPDGLRNKRHGRKGTRDGKRGRGVGGIPDINELWAERLTGGNPIRGVPLGSVGLFGFAIYDEIDRWNYPAMLIELTPDLIFKSMIGIVQFDKNSCPGMARLNRAQANDYIIASNSLVATSMSDLNYEHLIVSTIAGCSLAPPSRMYIATMTMSFDNPFSETSMCQIGLLRESDAKYVAISNIAPCHPGGELELSINAFTRENIGFQWHAMATKSVFSPHKQISVFSVTKS